MRSDHTNHGLPAEVFVVQLDGHVKSTHGRFVEALREALSLRKEFPQHEVKVRATAEASNPFRPFAGHNRLRHTLGMETQAPKIGQHVAPPLIPKTRI